ncbi:MAG: uridine diphosphate-N-acetylglucosamine-binding protein YvcK [Cellulomonadaceae bacterium]|nr:uridine diphosphate-N-acetylglucosamine-binding protein YvcK [Cellulomonadaceae bacterium]
MVKFQRDLPAVVALGGGHGLSASLSALRHISDHLTAVVTVADDGGSSGKLREELHCLPPGDLRMALAALCDDTDWGKTWSAVLQSRFASDGPLDHHAVGNLLIAGLWAKFPDPVVGLDWVAKLLGARGRVLPMSTVPLTVGADVSGAGGVAHEVVGQSKLAKCELTIDHLWIEPANPPVSPEVVKAILDSDWVVLGPGSWYTSVIVHLLVPELAEALHVTTAGRLLTMNLTADKETTGLGVVDHLEVLHAHAPGLRIDYVLADPSSIEDLDATSEAASRLGAELVVRSVATDDGEPTHDPQKLAAAYREIFAA